MDIREAIIHARQVAEGCGVDSRDCAYQHDYLADWLEELQAYHAKIPFDRLDEAAALVKAGDEGRAILPRVSERDKKGMADFLHDCFADWTHDPSVGLYGMTEGEAILANAIMDALTRAEAEAALGGGGDGL